jgi:hypothetical protein
VPPGQTTSNYPISTANYNTFLMQSRKCFVEFEIG